MSQTYYADDGLLKFPHYERSLARRTSNCSLVPLIGGTARTMAGASKATCQGPPCRLHRFMLLLLAKRSHFQLVPYHNATVRSRQAVRSFPFTSKVSNAPIPSDQLTHRRI
jgi:hypothetical protein